MFDNVRYSGFRVSTKRWKQKSRVRYITQTLSFVLFVALSALMSPPSNADTLGFFTTPFKNIYCVYKNGGKAVDNWVVCSIEKVSKLSNVKVPKYCEEWSAYFNGKTFYLGAKSKASLYCDPGDLWPLNLKDSDFKIVPYGKSIKIGEIVCSVGSKSTPLICVNKLGYGFSLSKSAQRLFQ